MIKRILTVLFVYKCMTANDMLRFRHKLQFMFVKSLGWLFFDEKSVYVILILNKLKTQVNICELYSEQIVVNKNIRLHSPAVFKHKIEKVK